MTVGVQPGYELKAQARMEETEMVLLYQRVAAKVLAETGVYVSAVCHASRAVYHEEWGCPPGGEPTFTFSGSCNPVFAEPRAYLGALRLVAKRLKEELSQKTVLLEMVPAHAEYFRDADETSK